MHVGRGKAVRAVLPFEGAGYSTLVAGNAASRPPTEWHNVLPSKDAGKPPPSAVPKSHSGLPFVDLFCGTGGLSCGLSQAGHRLIAGFDAWEAALRILNWNLPVHAGLPSGSQPGRILDLSSLKATRKALEEIKAEGHSIGMIVGGPPCQEFSIMTKDRKEGVLADLTPAYATVVSDARPPIFVMENVPNARGKRSLEEAIGIYRAAGYGLTCVTINAVHCGVPQLRSRLVCVGALGFQDGFLLEHLTRRLWAPITVRDHFQAVKFYTERQYYYRHPRHYGKKAVYSLDRPSPTIRGTNRPMPKSYAERIALNVAERIFLEVPDNDGAAPWDGVTHLDLEERGLVQGFPLGWEWSVPGVPRGAAEQIIGNAVPVGMGRVIGLALADWMEQIACEDVPSCWQDRFEPSDEFLRAVVDTALDADLLSTAKAA